MVHCSLQTKTFKKAVLLWQKNRTVLSAAVKFSMYRNLHRASHGPPFITASILTLLFARRHVKTEITQLWVFLACSTIGYQRNSWASCYLFYNSPKCDSSDHWWIPDYWHILRLNALRLVHYIASSNELQNQRSHQTTIVQNFTKSNHLGLFTIISSPSRTYSETAYLTQDNWCRKWIIKERKKSTLWPLIGWLDFKDERSTRSIDSTWTGSNDSTPRQTIDSVDRLDRFRGLVDAFQSYGHLKFSQNVWIGPEVGRRSVGRWSLVVGRSSIFILLTLIS